MDFKPVPLNAKEQIFTYSIGKKDETKVFYSGVLHHLAVQAYEDSKKSGERSDKAIIAIVFSVSAAESFINELFDLANVYGEKANNQNFQAIAKCLNDAEKSRKAVTDKFHLSKRVIDGSGYKKGEELFQHFQLLVRIRNIIVHSEAKNTQSHSIRDEKILKQLSSLRLISKEHSANFLNNIATSSVAKFACNASAKIIQDLYNSCKFPEIDGVFKFSILPPGPGPKHDSAVEELFEIQT